MGATKKDQYSQEQLDSARIGRAIAAPARVAILQHIHKYYAASNKDLQVILELADTTVHQHLQILVQTRFLTGNFFGDTHAYYFHPDSKADLKKIEWLLKKRP